MQVMIRLTASVIYFKRNFRYSNLIIEMHNLDFNLDAIILNL